MKKRQWRKLVTELLEMRNEATENHICVTSQMQELSDRLRAIERRLPPEPYPDWRTYKVMPGGTLQECEE